MIINPKTNRISPQFHCIHDDHFETIAHNTDTPKKKMDERLDELAFDVHERNEMELDIDDSDKVKNDWDFPCNDNEAFQMEPQVPPHVVKEPPVPVSSDSKSPNVEDSAHSPPLNDSSHQKMMFQRQLLLNRGR